MKSNKIVLKDKISAIIYFLSLACYRATLAEDIRKVWDPHITNVIEGKLDMLASYTDATNTTTSALLTLNKDKQAEWKELMAVIVDKPDALTSSAITKAQTLVTYKFGNNSYEQPLPFEFEVIEDDVAPAATPPTPPAATTSTEQQPVPAAPTAAPVAAEGPSIEALEADVAKWTKKLAGAEDEDEKAMYTKKLEAAKAALAAATPTTTTPAAGPSRAEVIAGMTKLATLLAQHPNVKEALAELMILAEEETKDGEVAMTILEEIEGSIDLTYTKPKGVAMA